MMMSSWCPISSAAATNSPGATAYFVTACSRATRTSYWFATAQLWATAYCQSRQVRLTYSISACIRIVDRTVMAKSFWMNCCFVHEPRRCARYFSKFGHPMNVRSRCTGRRASTRWRTGLRTTRPTKAAKMRRSLPRNSSSRADPMPDIQNEVRRRRTFAIISHPDAGKTTLTEKLLLYGGAIQLAGTVKGRKASRHATSDWMALEQQRGISVTSSVMQFPYKEHIVNLLDTPGHEDFSEDTYRTLTAVDSALMVIDCAKGVEKRTIKLMDVCRLRDTPIITFINKLDREGREPIELLDEIESVLKIKCAPITWPVGMGKRFKGIYHILNDAVHLYEPGKNTERQDINIIEGLGSAEATEVLGDAADDFREEIELVKGACPELSIDDYLAAR